MLHDLSIFERNQRRRFPEFTELFWVFLYFGLPNPRHIYLFAQMRSTFFNELRLENIWRALSLWNKIEAKHQLGQNTLIFGIIL